MAGAPANEVFAGPDGAAGTPTFRKLVSADLPGGGGGGTVTSVGLALPAEFNVTGSPVTASGTLTGVWATESANTVLAGPSSGASAAPTFRAVVSADLPAATALAEGIVQLATDLGGTASAPEVVATHLASPLPVAQGGSGTATPSLVAGTNITIAGSWPNQTIAASGGGGGTVPTSGWTNHNSLIYNDYDTPALLSYIIPDNASLNWRVLTQAVTVPYTFIATLRVLYIPVGANSSAIGFYLTDGTKLIAFEFLNQASGSAGTFDLRVEQLNSVTSDSGTAHGGATPFLSPSTISVKITNDSTTRTYYYYTSGAWNSFYSEAAGTWLTETAVGVGGLSITSAGANYVAGELIGWSLT